MDGFLGRNVKPSDLAGNLVAGDVRHGLADGSWDLVDLLSAIAKRTGPDTVLDLAIWTASGAHGRQLAGFLRSGKVVAQVADDLTGKGVMAFIKQTIDPEGSLLVTDEYPSYRAVRDTFRHAVVKHSETYVDGAIHTNTIEGVWALLKRAWYGSHHHYTKQFMPLFVAETCYKYNNRKNDNMFGTFLSGCFA